MADFENTRETPRANGWIRSLIGAIGRPRERSLTPRPLAQRAGASSPGVVRSIGREANPVAGLGAIARWWPPVA